MHYSQTDFLKKWSKLIFCPLDIQVPTICTEKFLNWAEMARDTDYKLFKYTTNKVAKYKKVMTEEEFIEDRKHNFWQAYYALSHQTVADSSKNNSQWANEFDKIFPELVEFYYSLPIKQIKTIGFLLQKKDIYSPLASSFHVDGPEIFGFRIFLNSKPNGFSMRRLQSNKINFLSGSINFNKDESFYTKGGTPTAENLNYDVVDRKEIYPNFPNNNCACVLTNFSACHAAYEDLGTGNETKITTLIMSDHKNSQDSYDYVKFDQLLEQSVNKYKDFVIWHDDDLS